MCALPSIVCRLFLAAFLAAQVVTATHLRTPLPAGEALSKTKPRAHVTLQATAVNLTRPSAHHANRHFHEDSDEIHGSNPSLGNLMKMSASNTESSEEGYDEDGRKTSHAAAYDANVLDSEDSGGDAEDDPDAEDEEVHVGKASPRNAKKTLAGTIGRVADEVEKRVRKIASDKEVLAAARAKNATMAEQSATTTDVEILPPSVVAKAISDIEGDAHTPVKANVVVAANKDENVAVSKKDENLAVAEKDENVAVSKNDENVEKKDKQEEEEEHVDIKSKIASALAAHHADGQDESIRVLGKNHPAAGAEAQKAAPLGQDTPDATMSALDAAFASS